MPVWFDVVLRLWPVLLTVLAALGVIVELRARKIVDGRITELTGKDGAIGKLEAKLEAITDPEAGTVARVDFRLREDLNAEILELAERAERAADIATAIDRRLIEVESRSDLVWGMVQRATAGLLKRDE